jgi:hypothetical protein
MPDTTLKLSGDTAYALFVSPDPFPLHDFLENWKADKVNGEVGYVLSVIGVYDSMLRNGGDGRYGGRKRGLTIR